MKRKAVALALTSLICSSSALADNAPTAPVTVSGGTVKFIGSIINAPCALNHPTGGQIVDLQQFRVSDLNKAVGDVTPARDFDLKLTDCSVETYKKARVNFNGVSVTGKNTILALDGDIAGAKSASGVGIQILSNGKPVAVDGTSTPAAADTVLRPGNTNMRFQAQYISTSVDVKPGAANASAEFTITYS